MEAIDIMARVANARQLGDQTRILDTISTELIGRDSQEKMQAVKSIQMKKILSAVILIIVLFEACSTTSNPHLVPTYNKGGYTLSKSYSNSLALNNSAIIYGNVRRLDSTDTVYSATLNVACTSVPVNKGYYEFRGPVGDEKTFLTCISIGLRSVETQHFTLEKGDSVKIDFFLTEDDRPIIDCEGQK